MPRMDSPDGVKSALVKLLLIGDGKLGKTHYAAKAAKAGFNVFYIDCDVGATTIANMVQNGELTKEEAARIYLIDVRDTVLGGQRDTRCVEFMNELTSSIKLRWNESEQRLAKFKDTGEIWEIRPSLMGPNDVLIFDSWTGFCESVMLWVGRANNVNIADANTTQMRPVYQGGALKATEMLQVIRSLRCHVIVIAHPDEYVHTVNPDGQKAGQVRESDKIIDWTKLVPKSTSKPQGLVMSKYFTDVAWMELSPAGNERRLNFKTRTDRVSGGHFHESKNTDEYSFGNLVKAVGGTLPDGKQEPDWITITIVEAQEAAPASPVLEGTKPAPIQGMANLFAKK